MFGLVTRTLNVQVIPLGCSAVIQSEDASIVSFFLILLLAANPNFLLPKCNYTAARIGVRGWAEKTRNRVINQGAHTHIQTHALLNLCR